MANNKHLGSYLQILVLVFQLKQLGPTNVSVSMTAWLLIQMYVVLNSFHCLFSWPKISGFGGLEIISASSCLNYENQTKQVVHYTTCKTNKASTETVYLRYAFNHWLYIGLPVVSWKEACHWLLRISLGCKLVPVQYREYIDGLKRNPNMAPVFLFTLKNYKSNDKYLSSATLKVKINRYTKFKAML